VRTDPNGVQSTWQYDGLGRLRVEQSPGFTRSTSYQKSPNEQGMLVSVSETGMGSTVITYDVHGREIQREMPRWDGQALPHVVTRTYDPVSGKLASVSRPFDGVPDAVPQFATVFGYDSLGRLESVSPPGASEITVAYEGLKMSTSVGGVLKTYRTTDELGRIVRSADVEPTAANGQIGTSFDYGPFGVLEHVRHDTESQIVTLVYDQLGRRIEIDDPDSGRRMTHYNAFGEVREEIDADQRVTDVSGRDLLGRIFRETADGKVSTVNWDAAAYGIGRPDSSSSAWGAEVHYGYQPNGMLASEDWVIGGARYHLDKVQDALGRPSSITYPAVPGGVPMQASYIYSPFDASLVEVDWLTSAGGATQTTPIWQKAAEAVDGQLAAAALGDGETILRHYDDASGRLRHISSGTGSVVVGVSGFPEMSESSQNLAYSYFDDGKLFSRDDLNLGLHETFGYDNADRLRNWNPTATASVTYDMGDTGNLTGRHYREQGGAALDEILTYAHPTKPHAITAAPWGTFSYDLSGRQKTRPGQPTVTYTAFDLPEQILQPGGTTTFGYDANHARVFKQGPTKSTTYVGGVYERRVTGSGVSHVFYLPGGEGVAAQVECVETLLEPNCSAPSYLHYDNLGSVEAVTDGSGTSTHRKRDPFGRFFDPTNPSSTVDPSMMNISIGFIGDEEDADLGLVNLQHRLYDPRAGRFISPDPLVHDPFWGQAHNRYTYALNNPMSYVDPTGLDSTPTDPNCTNCLVQEQVPGGDPFPPDFIDGPPPATGTEGLKRTTLPTPPRPTSQIVDPEDPRPNPAPSAPTAQAVTLTVAFDPTAPNPVPGPLADSRVNSAAGPQFPQGNSGIGVLADNAAAHDPLRGRNPFVNYNEDGSVDSVTIVIPPIGGMGSPRPGWWGRFVGWLRGLRGSGAAATAASAATGMTAPLAARFDPSRAAHIFREAPGHVNPGSAASIAEFVRLFEQVASNASNLRADAIQAGIITQQAAQAGVQAFTWIGLSGQVWVTTLAGVIQNAGINPFGAFR
jgi:RHS repeat-associated protein